MLIVLEGCDGVGKSTIARNLAKIMNARVIHCTTNTPNDYKFFKDIIDASKYQNIIADRFCYGQFVYQKPSERNLTWDELTQLELDMLDAGAKVVHVTAAIDDIKARLRLRGERTPYPVEKIVDGFINLFELSLEKPFIWWCGGED